MFGSSQFGWFGWDSSLAGFGADEDWSMTFFVFQMVFCGTAATIVSGAVAERMTLGGYIFCTVLIALLIYPISGHWVWGGALTGDEAPILAAMGFMDFAGGTVVHAVGGAVALAAIIVLGARKGRFDAAGNPIKIRGHSPVLATVGVLFIWVGWIGFNGGSTTVGSGSFAEIVYVTMIGGAVGGLTGMVCGYAQDRVWVPMAALNGAIAGLVGVTAGADVLTGQSAALVGAIVAVVAFYAEQFILNVCKLDDPVGAVAAHGIGGLSGTLLLAVFAPLDSLVTGDRLSQILVQLSGMGMVMAWAFGVAYVGLRGAAVLFAGPESGNGLRVPEHHEDVGLNASEHDAPLGTGLLETAIFELYQGDIGNFKPLQLERGDEAYEMSVMLNDIIGQLYMTLSEVEDSVALASYGIFSKRIVLEGKSGAALRLCQWMNDINALCEEGLGQTVQRVETLARGDLRGGETDHLSGQFADLGEAVEQSVAGLNTLIVSVAQSAQEMGRASEVGADISQTIAAQAQGQGTWTEAANEGCIALKRASEANLDTADKAAKQSALAHAAAVAGQTSAREAHAKITEVAELSGKIAKATEQINGIAKQVNILSINASVEAERAQGGAQTAGFKVVAQEVRKLAENTRVVVDAIQEHARTIDAAVAQGTKLVDTVARQFDGVKDAVDDSVQLAARVAELGRSQLHEVDQVAGAVAELRAASQATLASIQQAEAAAQAITAEAVSTQAAIGTFVLDDITAQGGASRQAA